MGLTYVLTAACYTIVGVEVGISDSSFLKIEQTNEMTAIDGAFYARATLFL